MENRTTNTPSVSTAYFSASSVAKRYQVSVNTIWRWSREIRGNFPQPVKLGIRSTRWRVSDLEAWEEQS